MVHKSAGRELKLRMLSVHKLCISVLCDSNGSSWYVFLCAIA